MKIKISDSINDDECTNNYLKIEELFSDIKVIKQDIVMLKTHINGNKSVIPIVSLKDELFDIGVDELLDTLSLNNTKSDMCIIKKYYFSSELVPIRRMNMRHYEYWDDGWKLDLYGKNIVNIISNNLYRTYLSVNTIDNLTAEQFISNQNYLFKIIKDKYKKNLLKEIVNELAKSS